MARLILLDSGPLGLACCRPGVEVVDRCQAWLEEFEDSDAQALLPSLVVYEVRREFLRLGAGAKLRNLAILRNHLPEVDTDRAALDRAAEFWAALRRTGRPTGPDADIDIDAILAGLAVTVGQPDDMVIVATTNLRHFQRFPGVNALQWWTVV